MIAAGTAVRIGKFCTCCRQPLWQFPLVHLEEDGVTLYATATACPDCDAVE